MKRQRNFYSETPYRHRVITCSEDSYSTLLFSVDKMLNELHTTYGNGYKIIDVSYLADKFSKKVYAVVVIQPKTSFFYAIKKALGLT